MKAGLFYTLFILSAMVLLSSCDKGKQSDIIFEPGVSVEKTAGGFTFTEGPASNGKGVIYFSDVPASRIYRYPQGGEVELFVENSGQSNGLFFDSEGKLIACAGKIRKLVEFDMQGNMKVLAEEYKGKKFNSPNDLWIDPKGGIYFTDPRYGKRDDLEMGEHVYYLYPDRQRIIRVIDDMVRPNGIIGDRSGKRLYVTDHGASKTYGYKINTDGTVTDKKLLAEYGSDGMAMDTRGNVYLTNQTVMVFNPAGELTDNLVVPEQPANICFGGKDNKTLYITARTGFYRVRTLVRGI
jgi:gluconolactonase